MELVISHPMSTVDHHHKLHHHNFTTAKRPSPPPPHLDDGLSPRGQHVCVTVAMFMNFLSSLLAFSSVARSHDTTVTVILFLYYTAMLHLQLIKERRRGNNVGKQLQASSQGIGAGPHQLMLVATGIMLISLATAVFIIRPDWRVFSGLATFPFLSASLVYLPMKLDELQREKAYLQKCQDASDLV